jgi:subtilisin family serine protease
MAKNSKSAKKQTEETKEVNNLFAKQNDRPRFTGRRIVMMNKEAPSTFIKKFTQKTSLNLASIRDFKSDVNNFHEAFNQADGIYFDTFKIAVINEGNEEPIKLMQDANADTRNSIISEPERFVYAFPAAKTATKKPPKTEAIDFKDYKLTWGAQAIKINNAQYTGKGINIAVLDTGLNLSHPDFARLTVQSKSFIKNQAVEDKNGHGTHCSGIAVGAYNQKEKIRYGVAYEANLFIGKVLSNQGSGNDSGILAGIEWALQNKCKVISMSLGSAVEPGETYSPAYERVAKTAIDNGCLIVAAAGNESERQFGLIKPVGHPANCPSVLAVAALDEKLKVAYFSCGGLNIDGGQVDVAAPGVNIYSSWMSKKYNTISGTSMATPFVAGLAATYWQAYPQAKAADIWMYLVQNALRLNQNSSDVGAGLVQSK